MLSIMYVTNEQYAPICATSMASMFENNKDEDRIVVHLFCDEMGYKCKEMFAKLCDDYYREIKFYECKEIIESIKALGLPKYKGNFSCYVRWGGIERIESERLIYLDCDTLVIGSLSDLYKIDMDKLCIGAVIDNLTSYANIAIKKDLNSLYFNTGVLLVDVHSWKERGLFELMAEKARTIDISKTATNSDQDLFNYALSDKTFVIDPKYNLLPQVRRFSPSKLKYMINKDDQSYYSDTVLNNACDEPVVVHFAGDAFIRPWYKNSDDEYAGFWKEYMSKTPFCSSFVINELKLSKWRYFAQKCYNFLPESVYALLKRKQEIIKQYSIRKGYL